jgi:hypothetical protein
MAFTGSSSNRAQLAYKVEGAYPANFGVTPAGNGALLNMTGETLDFQIKTLTSKAIRADRLPTDVVQVSATAAGGFNAEHVYKEYDPFIEQALQSDFVKFGTGGVTAAVASLTAAANTLTAGAAPTGNDAWTTLKKGQWFVIQPAAGATQAMKDYLAGRAFRVSPTTGPTATVITLDTATPFDTTKGTNLNGAALASGYAWNGASMKTFSLEVQHQDIGQYRQYTGMAVSKMDLKLTVGEIVSLAFEFMGKASTLAQASIVGSPAASQAFTPANATRGIFDVFEAGVSMSTTSYIKSGEISFDNTLRGQEAVSVFGMAGIGVGTHNITGKMEVYFADAVMYTKFLNNTASSLSIPILDINGNGYVYYFPRIKYSAGKVNAAGQDQDTMLSMDWMALPEVDPTSPWVNKSAVIFRVGAA